MKRNVAIASIVAILLLAGAHLVHGTPQYSLFRFAHALQKHDADTAFQYIDVDAVVEALVTGTIQETVANQEPSFPPRETGDEATKAFISQILPSFKEAASNEIRAAIQQPAKSGSRGVFAFFTGSASWRDFDIKKQGKTAYVTRKSDKAFAAKLAQVSDGHWKIVQLMPQDVKVSSPQQKPPKKS